MRLAFLWLFCAGAVVSAETTYTRDVARIMQAKCQQCHRPNDVAPFALMTYDDVATYAEDIRTVLKNKTMPPWKPVAGFNAFLGSYALSEDERNVILSWIEGGTPQGDPADMPAPAPVSDSAWELGPPDMVLAMPEYTPPIRATDTYRCFVLPTALSDNRFISAMQALPGNPQIVHHVVLFLDRTGESEKLDSKDGQLGYSCFGGPNLTSSASDLLQGGTLGAWVPGARTRRLADDIGTPITKGPRIVMQVHYHPSGREGSDKTQLGIWFADAAKIRHRLINVPVVNTEFVIPAGAVNYEVPASLPISRFLSGKIVTVTPHMHNLGKQIKVEVQDADGTKRPIIYIDNWDFNWQGSYTLAEPAAMPAGSTVRVMSTFDNSADNLKNPNNPIVPVGWGERTSDEMVVALIGVIFDNEAVLQLPFNQGTR